MQTKKHTGIDYFTILINNNTIDDVILYSNIMDFDFRGADSPLPHPPHDTDGGPHHHVPRTQTHIGRHRKK